MLEQESARQLEILLGSLIKMVGKLNERVDNLDRRIQQIEWAMRETHLTLHERESQYLYAYLVQKK